MRGQATALSSLPPLTEGLRASLALEIVESDVHPIVIVSRDLRLVFANRSCHEIFQLSQTQAPDLFLDEIKAGAWDKPQLLELIDDLISQKRSSGKLQMEFDLPSQGRRTFALAARPISAVEGAAPLIVLSLEDVTHRRKSEKHQQDHTDDLERSNSDLEQFAYIASHDLQEPLRMVASFTQLLATRYQGKLDADADEYIAFAVDGAQRMRALINDLLAFSRIGRKEIEYQPTDCGEVLRVVGEDLNAVIAESGAVISYEALPTVVADPRQLGQVFQNLVSNAIKFRSAKPPEIVISASRNETEWTFSVRDNGIGIPADQAHRIFEIFQRLHSRSEYPGSGIGLAVCKKIVVKHGGSIWQEPGREGGTIFLFTLPLEPRRKF